MDVGLDGRNSVNLQMHLRTGTYLKRVRMKIIYGHIQT